MEEYYYVVPTQIFLCLDDGVYVAQIANAEADFRRKKNHAEESATPHRLLRYVVAL